MGNTEVNVCSVQEIDSIILGLSFGKLSEKYKFLKSYKDICIPLKELNEGIVAFKLVRDIFAISGSEARNLIKGKGVYINGHPIQNELQIIDLDYTLGNSLSFILSKGRLGRNYTQYTVKGTIDRKDIIETIAFDGIDCHIFKLD